ncbi:hypothetical protein AvCA_38110 [Azotobacter vinelandii CA]|uniref:Uncharacterized protein n=2 Tax=Azotobacter vinelandii TaxID=354 RepID=C1DS78_AZOVD|nr:hypothetical protein Avin_38110 [Azotobacter vinelandii DJ]AGK14521.1 hypothetical protein AvCA_38110 [Azotobacter vinelandii CA]AGK21622.1 hypothetical protein AvCA6_38110 [Azotobacter vinelandii CA6]
MHGSSALEQSAASGRRNRGAGGSDWRRENPYRLLDGAARRATKMYRLVSYSFDYRTKAPLSD